MVYCDDCCDRLPPSDRYFTERGGALCDVCRAKREAVQNSPYVMTSANRRRVRSAQASLDTFRTVTNMLDEPDRMVFRDLLCNLMHWAHRNGIVFNCEMDVAADHYQIERTGVED